MIALDKPMGSNQKGPLVWMLTVADLNAQVSSITRPVCSCPKGQEYPKPIPQEAAVAGRKQIKSPGLRICSIPN